MDRLIDHEALAAVKREKDPGQWSIATALVIIVSLADDLEPGTPERRALATAAAFLRPTLRLSQMGRSRRRRGLLGRGPGGPTAATVAPGFTLFLYQLPSGLP